jgi:hypothetical protein
MNDAHDNPLTPQGEARRDGMLGELAEIMSRTHRARRVRRRVIGSTGCLGLLLVVGRLAMPLFTHPGEVRPQIVEHLPNREAPAAAKAIAQTRPAITLRVRTDPSIVERYRAAPTGAIVRMDDATLIETLAAIHRPAGLIRFADRVALSAPVTDAELGIGQ